MSVLVAFAMAPRRAAHGAIRFYQLTLSSLLGRRCRYLPTCSDYADEAICRHGLWAGGWMGLARICRCHPLGGAGYDPPPAAIPEGARWLAPWRYGAWRQPTLTAGDGAFGSWVNSNLAARDHRQAEQSVRRRR